MLKRGLHNRFPRRQRCVQFSRRAFRAEFYSPVRAGLILLVLLGAGVFAQDQVAGEPSPSVPTVDFSREIKPLLAKRCFACHGAADNEGGLRLNERETALAELDSGNYAIVPGEAEGSELLARISSDDESVRMPPEGEPLSPREIELIRRWISEGARWETHWAFGPPRSPVPQEFPNREWVRTPIDAFILEKLEANGLEPNPPAGKVALLRRATYNLTGLPPTPAEVQNFLADDSPEAFEKVLDRLLDSPRYGERWGRHWLDLVRFAETNSFERDGLKPHAWRFRDYVIRSFNDDKPYDQFIREQLAGDELPRVTADSIIATGFYRLGLWDDEPADRLQAKYDALDDIISTTGEVFLGLTTGCARCHDHKIDPLPQQEYYSLLAFFQGVTPMAYGGPQVERPVFKDGAARVQYQKAVEDLRDRRNAVQAQITAVEDEFQKKAASAGDGQQADLDDLEYRFYRDTWDRLPDFDQLKPETVAKLQRPYFDIRPATRPDFFGFVFTGVLKVPEDGRYTFTLDSDDGSRLLVDGKTVVEYDGIHGVGNPRSATVELAQGRLPIRLEYFQKQHGKGLAVTWAGPNFGPRYLSATTAQGVDIADLHKKPLPELLKALGPQVLGARRYKNYEDLKKKLDALKREKPAADYALCVTEVGREAPPTRVLYRGNPHVPREQVEPAFPSLFGAAVPEIPAPPPNAMTSGRRRVLAEWIASPDNILTARVMVNRLWQHHFGRGIVRSPNNFGQLGDPPTHPELLDWLAGQFVREGWRLKPLHKQIMLSSAYQMSSQGGPDGLEKDPANDLFWRFNMRRLSAEEIRDSIHAVNGRLNLKMYGPGVYPELSKEVLATQSQPGKGWGKSSPEEQARRSIYIHVKRSLITPLLSNFDFPDTDAPCAERFATTQPGQALGLMNSQFLHQQAAHFARRLKEDAGDDRTAQVRRALELALSRVPEDEVARGVELIAKLEQTHGLDADTALNYYCLVVLNLNEFVYLD